MRASFTTQEQHQSREITGFADAARRLAGEHRVEVLFDAKVGHAAWEKARRYAVLGGPVREVITRQGEKEGLTTMMLRGASLEACILER